MSWNLIVLLAVVPGTFVLVTYAILHASRKAGTLWRLAAALASLPAGIVAASLVWVVGKASVDSGTWACVRCAAHEERESLFGISSWSSSPDPLEEGRRPKWMELPLWYRERHPDHDHVWQPVGCHSTIFGVACSMDMALTHFHALAELADQELARAALEELVGEPRKGLHERMDSFQRHRRRAWDSGGLHDRAWVDAWLLEVRTPVR